MALWTKRFGPMVWVVGCVVLSMGVRGGLAADAAAKSPDVKKEEATKAAKGQKKKGEKANEPVIQPAAVAAAPNAPEEPKGMTALFQGNSLSGWDGDSRFWSIDNGVVTGQTTDVNKAEGNTFLIWKGGDLKDFELRFSFRINIGNSGCQFRSHMVDSGNPRNKWMVGGYQAEIENTYGKVGFLYHEKGDGSRGYPDRANALCKVGDRVEISEKGELKVVGTLGDKPAIAAAYKPGDWNDYIIIAKGNTIRQYINGVQTVDLTDNDVKNKMSAGLLALQIHQGQPMKVEFKNLRLKQQ